MKTVAILAARLVTDAETGMHGNAGVPPLRALLRFAGQTLVEYQARQAAAMGASEIAILIDAPHPGLAAAVDRLQQDGIRVSLLRDMSALARLAAADDRLLLIADGHVLPMESLTMLAEHDSTAALLTMPSGPETDGFERIDTNSTWAGAATGPGALMLATIDMLGDWDLMLTLMRRIIQSGAARIACDPRLVLSGGITILNSAAAATEAGRLLVQRPGNIVLPVRSSDDMLLGAVTVAVAGMAARRGLASGMMATLASVFALIALAVAVFWDMKAAAALGIAALLIQRTAQRVDAMLRLGSVLGSPWNLPLLLILATVLAIGWREGGDEPLARAGAVMTVALLAFLPHIRGPKGNGAGWWCIGPASALLLLMLADIAGLTPAGLAIVALLATAGLAVQHGLPRNGRDRRGSDV